MGRTGSDAPLPFEGVLFDLFGTLIPTGALEDRTRNLEAVARALGVDADGFSRRWLDTFDDRVRGRLGTLEQTIVRLAREVGGAPVPQAIDQAVSLRLAYARSLFDAGAASLEELLTLRHRGLRLALVSDTSDDTVRIWPSTAFAPLFDETVFSCEVGVRKPDRRIYAIALERLGLAASACAFVGDGGSHELSGARAAGLAAFQYLFPEDGRAFRVDADADWNGPRLARITDLARERAAGR